MNIKNSSIWAVIALTGVVGSAVPASANFVEYSHITPLANISTVDTFNLTGFNPALGTLTGVTITLEAEEKGIVSVINITTSAKNFANATNFAPVTVTGPPAQVINISPTIGPFASPPPAPARPGGPGTFGEWDSPVTDFTQLSSTAVPVVDWGFYIGIGPVVSFTTTIGDQAYTGASVAGLFYGGDAAAGGETTVRYDFIPNFTLVPEPASLGLLGSGLVLAGFAARRRKRAEQKAS